MLLMLSAQPRICVTFAYLGGYRDRALMGGGAFYDTVTVYVAAPE